MSDRQNGFGLLEVMLALAIGLMCLAAVSQVFVSAHQAWRLQGSAAQLQDDARLALLRMAQDIRMAGMFGCLRLQADDFQAPGARQAFARPLQVGPSSLSLIVAELPGYTGIPDWTLLTDCIDQAQVHGGRAQSTGRFLAVPISRHDYVLVGSELKLKRGGRVQPLVNHVRELRIERVDTPEGERFDLKLTLYEPDLRLEQYHELSVMLRNPVIES
ncbi:PilW family protein [Pseudomonas sp. Teo4]|uniref:PilW family protein n=1 Tax=Pseudomonas sp. Teo4 TaxID=3064528 RepID=UPI002AB8EA66|nr:prepilin-type N-terminal cleavage/methylation domain-containing protein [Pseudomonas sp. Teo4]MDZ3993882.1 hypothetical protein [Pseudomonas sp. Teo4]